MLKKITFCFGAVIPALLFAQVNIENPRQIGQTAFAIFIDSVTYSRTQTDVQAYRDILEKEGLSTYIVSAGWESPEQVKTTLIDLYNRKPVLEGVVFIGEIPVVLVRNAQHTASACKIPEDDTEQYPLAISSVTSDRFYDDLHLKFEYICRDENNPLHFYYKLSEDGAQQLSPSFYSARIFYPKEKGGDSYAAIGKFLRKIVRERSRDIDLDRLTTYHGNGYNSDCLIAWMDEQKALNENFPGVKPENRKAWDFREERFMKFRILDELEHSDIDVMLFNEHGSPEKQHISAPMTNVDAEEGWQMLRAYIYDGVRTEGAASDSAMNSVKAYAKRRYGVLDSYFDRLFDKSLMDKDSIDGANMYIYLEDLKDRVIQPRFVMFNACYNGSFNRDGYVAGYYLFNDGRTVVTQANTINVLQDKWTYELVGLLSHGIRVGEWNRMTPTLEGHLLGDPTWRFRPVAPNRLHLDMILSPGDTDIWMQYLNSEYADVQSLAVKMLERQDTTRKYSSLILSCFKNTEHATTRMECLKTLSRYNNVDFHEAVILGLFDSYELVRRNAAYYSGRCGNKEFIPAVMKVYFHSESHRVIYALEKSMALFGYEELLEEAATQLAAESPAFKDSTYNEMKRGLLRIDKRKHNDLQTLLNKKAPLEDRKLMCRFLRNNAYHDFVPQYLAVLEDTSDDLRIRVMLAEALGWFNLSYRKPEIVAVCQKLLKTTNEKELRDELLQTINRLR